MEEEKRNVSYTALKLCHAKSLQDISELKKLRESVGKNILEACLLVDNHERDLSQHCQNLRRTRQNFSIFEKKLSDASFHPVTKKYQNERYYVSLSSGEEGSGLPSKNRRPTGYKGDKRMQCSDAQSLSSASSYSPKECRRNSIWKQISVPIYEDSIDSGVYLSTDFCQEVLDPRSSTFCSDDERIQYVSHRSQIRKDPANSPTSDSDTMSSVSCRASLPIGTATRDRVNSKSQFVLSNTWRSTPNILECQSDGSARRRCSLTDASFSDQPFPTNRKTRLMPRENRSVSRKCDWKSMPELVSSKRKDENCNKNKVKKKKRGFFYLMRRLTKTGEYVLKDDTGETKQSRRKRHSKKEKCSGNWSIGSPAFGSPLGRVVEVIEGKENLYRVEIKLPSNGLYGFYIQQGFKKIKKGIFIGSFVNEQTEKLFSGILRRGDEIIRLNSLIDDKLTLKNALELLSNDELLSIILLPYSHRKSRH